MTQAPPFPSTVRVGYRDYKVIVFPASESRAEQCLGRCDNHRGQIKVDETIIAEEPAQAANTLLHEIIHACWYVGDIENDDKQEKTVSVLTNQLGCVWRDNPDVIAYLDWAFRGQGDV